MKNIYRTACWIACLLCCVHTLCGKNVEGDVNYVLIINTYTESTPWSNSMIYPIWLHKMKNWGYIPSI